MQGLDMRYVARGAVVVRSRMRALPGGQAVVLTRLDPLAAGLGAQPSLSAQRGCFSLFARGTWTRWV